MKVSTTISRYVFKELIAPFAISLLFLTFIFLMTKIPELTNMVVNYNTGILSLLKLLLFSLPRLLEFTIPMSVMISVMLTFMRMAGDNEIMALKGSGVSIYRLLPPVLLFCFLGMVVSVWVTTCGVPWSKLEFKKETVNIARSNIDIALQERTFNTAFEDVMIYVSSVDIKTRELKDIFIEDSRAEGMVNISVAPQGLFISDRDRMRYTLRLYNGKINQVNLAERSVNTVTFATYDINFDLMKIAGHSREISKDLDELSLGELVSLINDTSTEKAALRSALMEFHEKFSLPFACIALGILAFPLGIQSVSLRRSSGFGLGMFFFVLYYLLLAAGWSGGETGHYPPVVGMWLPDILMGGAGLYLLHRNAVERPLKIPYPVARAVSAARGLFRKYDGK